MPPVKKPRKKVIVPQEVKSKNKILNKIIKKSKSNEDMNTYNILANQFSRDNYNMFLNGKYEDVVILGVGGIGSWVAYYLGSFFRKNERLFLVDPDIVELSNLSRTPFRYNDVSLSKTTSLKSIIMEKNIGVNIISINKLSDQFIDEDIKSYKLKNVLLIDCRDNFYDDYDKLKPISNKIIRVAYDGYSITLDPNPETRKVWSVANGYTVVPSSIFPSSLAALLIIYMLNEIINNTTTESSCLTFNSKEIFSMLLKQTQVKK